MGEFRQGQRSLQRQSHTTRELCHIAQEIERMEQLSPFDEARSRGDYGFKASAKGIRRSSGWHQKYNRLRAQKQLVERGLIELEQTGDQVMRKITDKGRIQLLKTSIIECDEELPNNHQCLVAYDIPEHIRYVRERLRRFLKKAGFRMLQQSVWGTDKNVVADMKRFIQEIGLNEQVNVSVTS